MGMEMGPHGSNVKGAEDGQLTLVEVAVVLLLKDDGMENQM